MDVAQERRLKTFTLERFKEALRGWTIVFGLTMGATAAMWVVAKLFGV